MSWLKVTGTVDRNGVMTAKLPPGAVETTVDVLVGWPPKCPEAESAFIRVLSESFGSSPDLERPDQGELPAQSC
jgi:hypothetical protein